MNDWYCSTCNFTIFGSKNSCKKCGQPKPKPNPKPVFRKVPKPEPDSDIIRNIKQQRDAELKLYLSEVDAMRVRKTNELKEKAIQEGLPPLYYVTSCTECKSFNPKPGHNCWKYQ